MDDLLHYFEEELGLFGVYAREFRKRFPKPAGELHITGEVYEDPSVARLIQSVALMSARIHKRLDDDYPKFTESLLESLYPHFLRPLPSYSIAQLAGGTGDAATLASGTVLQSAPVDNVVCQFRTVYEVSRTPVVVTGADYASVVNAPRALRLPRGTSGCVSLTVESSAPGADLGAGPLALRLFVDAEASLRAALIDALFLHASAAWVQADGDSWRPIAQVPLALAGLGGHDAMLPFPARSHPAFRLLTEYFTYPDKFHFIDLDLVALRPLLPARCRRFTLHLPLSGVAADSNEARILATLSHKHLLPGCTPVINLFDKPGVPLQLSHTGADYALLADAAHASDYEVYSVNAVRLLREGAGGGRVVDFDPLYAGRQDAPAGSARNYWLIRRDAAIGAVSPGHEVRISLLDATFSPARSGGATLSTELSCTNRDLPSRLRYDQAEGDLRTESLSATPIRLLRKPTPSYRFETGNAAHWRLVSHLALCYARLTDAGLADFQKMLALYDVVRSPASQRLAGGVTGLGHGLVRGWVKTLPASTLMPGIAIRMTVDQQAFTGHSLYVFAQVMDRYFAMNAQLNCFTQLTVVSGQTGQEIIRCPPRTAEQTRA